MYCEIGDGFIVVLPTFMLCSRWINFPTFNQKNNLAGGNHNTIREQSIGGEARFSGDVGQYWSMQMRASGPGKFEMSSI